MVDHVDASNVPEELQFTTAKAEYPLDFRVNSNLEIQVRKEDMIVRNFETAYAAMLFAKAVSPKRAYLTRHAGEHGWTLRYYCAA